MRYLTHDGSFAGILSCIYYAYEAQLNEIHISTEDVVFPSLFTESDFIATDFVEAKKVAKKIIELVGYSRFKDLWKVSLSNDAKVGNMIFELIRFIQLNEGIMLYDYSHPAIKRWIKELKLVKESIAQLKFDIINEIGNESMITYIEPEINLIPLLFEEEELKSNFDSAIVFDSKREYGIFLSNGSSKLIGVKELEENNFSVNFERNQALENEKLWVLHLENYKPNRLLRNRRVIKAS